MTPETGKIGAPVQRPAFRQRPNVRFDGGDPIRFDHIGLADGYRPRRRFQQVQDRQMLAGLRHDAIVGRDHQQRQIDAGDARQHRPDKLLMTGHVDEADPAVGAGI